MKVLAYQVEDGPQRAGVLVDEVVVEFAPDLFGDEPWAPSRNGTGALETLLRMGSDEREAVHSRASRVAEDGDDRFGSPLEAVSLRPPYVYGRKILCQAVNYPEHGKEADIRPPDRPFMFLRPPTSVIGPGDPILAHACSSQVDYEVELAVVVGAPGRNIPAGSAYEHIAGYTILNDVSYRDLQYNRDAPGINDRFGRNWTHGKGLDSSCPVGPWVTLSDEVPEPYPLDIRSYVNGELRQKGSTQEQLFKIPELVAYASRGMTLQTGDLIATGTPAGVGAASGSFLNPDDRVVCAIERLGEIENPVRLE